MPLLTLVWLADILGEALLFGRLAWLGLLGRYRWFALHVGVAAIRDIVGIAGPPPHTMYNWRVWAITDPMVLALQVAMVLEAHRHVTSAYPGIGSFGRTAFNRALLIGAVVSLLISFVEASNYVVLLFELRRFVTAICAVFLLCIAWLYFWVKVAIPLNTIRHTRIMTIYFSVNALCYLSTNLGAPRYQAGIVLMIGALICDLLWTFFLDRAGESVGPPDPVSPEEAARMLGRFGQRIKDARSPNGT